MTTVTSSGSSAFNVLVVDDHASFQKRASILFAAAGCQVATANDGLAAIEAAHRERFDVILMDRRMPRCGGDRATVSIRAGSESSDALIVSHSADTPNGDDADIYDQVVPKPIQAAHVIDLIAAAEARVRTRLGGWS